MFHRTRSTTSIRPRLGAILALLLIGAFTAAAPSTASAHDTVVSTSPAAESTTDGPPTEVAITFSAELLSEGGSAIVDVRLGDQLFSEGDVVIDGQTAVQQLTQDAPAGEYTVLWRVVSSDGHATSGEFAFRVGETAPVVEPEPSPIAGSPSATPVPTPEPAVDEGTTPAADTTASRGGSSLPIILLLSTLGLLVVAGIALGVLWWRRSRTHHSEES